MNSGIRRAHFGSGAATQTNPRSDEALDRTWRRLAHIEQLEANWDSYGAQPPAAAAIAAARMLITTVQRLFGVASGGKSRPYAVAPLVDGGIQVEWRGHGGNIEIEISPRNQFSYYWLRSDPAGHSSEGDGVSMSTILDLVAKVLLPEP